ncbi:MAG: phosphatidylserine decarboxylase, partial [Colwellia sp.]|nr:phosphatidylserine decarboxylase [Colwellia sp.]
MSSKNNLSDKIKITMQYMMPKHAISRLVGKLAAAKMGW